MDNAQQENSVERRRRLLKGALGASAVVTLGYGGTAAAASLGCVEKVRMNGGAPANGFQFTMTNPSSVTTVPRTDWAWQKIVVSQYKQANNYFFGFVVNGIFFRISNFATAGTANSYVPGSVPQAVNTSPTINLVSPQPTGYPRDGWVLAYFTDGGDPNGIYPSPNATVAAGNTPAAYSCLASINPGLNLSGFTFGG